MVAFIRQYQYNFDMALDRMQLQNMCKKENESFKEYAQRWKDLAAQVVPPMMEREMITLIVDTLPVFYYEKMVGYMPSSFAHLVFASEKIEVGLRRGKFDYPALMNRKLGANGENKKEGKSVLLITHHPTSHERLIIHKGHPQISQKSTRCTSKTKYHP